MYFAYNYRFQNETCLEEEGVITRRNLRTCGVFDDLPGERESFKQTRAKHLKD